MNNFSDYDKNTRGLVEKFQELYGEDDSGALTTLRKLKKIGEEKKDHWLLGWVYFYLANIYYDTSKYEKFQHSLREAIRHLLRSKDRGLLARAYNFFAIDAQSNDALDVAYTYYSSALRFVDEDKAPGVVGIVVQNLASFNYIVGNHDLARKYYRKAIKLIERNKNDLFYNRNKLITIVNDGINSVVMDDLPAAKKALKISQKILGELDEEIVKDVVLALDFLEVRIALAEGNKETIEDKAEYLFKELDDETISFMEMEDIVGLCQAYLDAGRHDFVERLLSVITPHIEEADVTHVLRILADIEIQFYQESGDEKSLVNSLRKRHRIMLRQKEEQAQIHKYSMELIEIAGELREEEARLRLENQHLRKQILMDTLTGIPNRYAFDQELSQAFERGFKSKKNLGIAILDIDEFKIYNDKFGHQVGDLCLEKVGEILAKIAGEEEVFVARYGGDEFVVIYEGKEDEEINRISNRIGAEVSSSEVMAKRKKVPKSITLSQGACNDVPRVKSKPWDFLSQADEALYERKENRGGEVIVKKLPRFS